MIIHRLSLIIAYTYSKDPYRLIGLAKLIDSIRNQFYTNFEVIVVEDLQGRLESKFPFKELVDKVVTISDPHDRKFNKAWVMNVGARVATTDHLVFIDAEISFDNQTIRKINEFICDDDLRPLFNGWSSYICRAGRDNPKERVHVFSITIKAMIGIWYCRKDFYFNKLGGFNENYFGYGGEDNDVFFRAQYVSTRIPCIDNVIVYHNYHHWHPPEGPNPLSEERFAIMKRTEEKTQEVIDTLIKSSIGDPKCPNLI